jgi:hypothetical protein
MWGERRVSLAFAGSMSVAAWAKASNVTSLWRLVFKGI